MVDHGEVIADDTAERAEGRPRRRPRHPRLAADTRAGRLAERRPAASVRVEAREAGGTARTVEIRTADGPGAAPGLLARRTPRATSASAAVEVTRPTLDDVFLEPHRAQPARGGRRTNRRSDRGRSNHRQHGPEGRSMSTVTDAAADPELDRVRTATAPPPQRRARHPIVLVRELPPGGARPVLAGLRPRPAAGLPRAVRPAARRLGRRPGRRARRRRVAVVRAGHPGHDHAVRHVDGGSNLQFDLSSGVHERMLVTPLSRPAQLVGRALKEMVPISAQSAIVVRSCCRSTCTRSARCSRWCCSRCSASASARCRTRWRSRCASRSGCSGSCSRRSSSP